MYYFYCPNCEMEDEIEKMPKGTIPNIRDGYGTPIHHYECPNCHNLYAGFMRIWHKGDEEDEKKYYQCVIRIYQKNEEK